MFRRLLPTSRGGEQVTMTDSYVERLRYEKG